MQWLYPTFLWAAAALLIPLLIHLFHLRKYRKEYFPHTKFLQRLNIQSRRPKNVQQRLLLLLRMLFLLALVLAFAQPYISKNPTGSTSKLYAAFIDNSYSMSLRSGASDLLDIAKARARQWVDALPDNAEVLLVTHDAPAQYESVHKEKASQLINDITYSSAQRSPGSIVQQVHNLQQTENLKQAELYYFSDFQQNQQWSNLKLEDVKIVGVQLPVKNQSNAFIDTAWLAEPTLSEQNILLVRSKQNGEKQPSRLLQLLLNGQLVSAATAHYDENGISTDTLFFSSEQDGWQQIQLQLQDEALRFDDTFRMAARLSSTLKIAHLTASAPNPYVLAALHSDPKIVVKQQSWTAFQPEENDASLIVLDGFTQLSENDAQRLQLAMKSGAAVLLIPAKNDNYSSFNPGLRYLTSLYITGINEESQNVTALHHQHDLVKDIFELIPKQVQLPTVHWHYTFQSSFSANRQSVMSFRNADPFLASYDAGNSKLYVLSSAASLEAGNFAGSYFFVPFLHRMAVINKGGNTYALRAGKGEWVLLPMRPDGERSPFHLYAQGKDLIPMQRAQGNGVALYTDASTTQPGFYRVHASGANSALIALNPNIAESDLQYYSMEDLKSWEHDQLQFVSDEIFKRNPKSIESSEFPIWKVCVLLALLLLTAESVLIWRNLRWSGRTQPS